MIDYSHIYNTYINGVNLDHRKRFNVLLFMIYVQTRNIPVHLFNEAFSEYKEIAEHEDIVGVERFLQHVKEEKI